MNATRAKKLTADESVPLAPQVTAPAQGAGDYSPFVWKSLGDIQQTLGRLEASLDQVRADLIKVDAKLDKVEGKLSGVTHKIYAAGVVLVILVAVGGFVVNKAWDLMAKAVFERPVVQMAPAAVALPAPPAPKKP